MALRGEIDAAGYVISFAELKTVMRELCAALDGRFLLPGLNPYVVTSEGDGQVTMRVNDGSFFSFPAKDVVRLPVANVTVELLARVLCQRFIARVGVAALASKRVTSVSISVAEVQGQEARATARISAGPDAQHSGAGT